MVIKEILQVINEREKFYMCVKIFVFLCENNVSMFLLLGGKKLEQIHSKKMFPRVGGKFCMEFVIIFFSDKFALKNFSLKC